MNKSTINSNTKIVTLASKEIKDVSGGCFVFGTIITTNGVILISNCNGTITETS